MSGQAHTDDSDVRWERVLWKKQPYADNYVGPEFLRVKKKRLAVGWGEAMIGATAVSQEIFSCLLLVAVFWGLADGQLTALTTLVITTILTALPYINRLPGLGELKLVVFTLVVTGGVSSIVRTLTASVATDTVHASTAALLALHLLLQYYGADVAVVNVTLSHNLGVFASVCLASRLSSHWDVFALITAAIALFAIMPHLRTHSQMNKNAHMWQVWSTVVIGTITSVAVIQFVPSLLPLMLITILVCNVCIPVLFVYMQHYRQNIYGPWDEAQIM